MIISQGLAPIFGMSHEPYSAQKIIFKLRFLVAELFPGIRSINARVRTHLDKYLIINKVFNVLTFL